MSEPSRSDAHDFYLRYLLDYPAPHVDTEVRACRIVRWLQVDAGREGAPGTEDPASVPSSVLHVVVAPPLPMMGDEEQGIMLGPYYPGSLVLPQARSSLVRIYRVTDWSGVSGDQVRIDVLHTWWPAADIAPTPSLLPLTPEQAYQRGPFCQDDLRRPR